MATEWTNCESSRTKVSLADLRYIEDPFCGLLCGQSALKRSSEINRGYFVRFESMNHVIKTFCSLVGDCAQVVNIGSGFDSLYFRLRANGIHFSRVIDVDSPHVITTKIRQINKFEQLWRHLEDRLPTAANSLHSRYYHCVGADATKGQQLSQLLVRECDLRPELPVLFVFECVLLYWTEDQTTSLLNCLQKSFPKSNHVVFDLVNTCDTFARVMSDALSERETPLLGMNSSRTLDDWNRKFVSNGYQNVISWDLKTVYEELIPAEEVRRIESLEPLDERQLLSQLLNHYCLVMASNHRTPCW